MALDQDTWTHWGPQRQVDFINRLKGKIRLYARYNADWQRWVDLAQNASADTGEWVYPVPLTDLP
jgi:serine/threonine-protein kinase PpkA